MANPLICVFNPVTTLIDQIPSQSIFTGVSAAGSPVVLNQQGVLDPSLLGQGTSATAGELISSGAPLVNLYPVGGSLYMQNAFAAAVGTAPSGNPYPVPAVGFVANNVSINNSALVLFSGFFTYGDPNSEFGAADIGKEVYLSTVTKGGVTKTRPTGPGQLQQTIGNVVGFQAPNFVQIVFIANPPAPALNNFDNIGTGTNTLATMTVGTGATLNFTGTGVVNANELYSVVISSTPPSVGQVLTATSPTAADWATPSGGGGTPGGASGTVQFNNSGAFGGLPGSVADGANGTLAILPTGFGVALTVSGAIGTGHIVDFLPNGSFTPVWFLSFTGLASHTSTLTVSGSTSFSSFYSANYVLNNTFGAAVLLVNGINSTLTYKGSAGDPSVAIIAALSSTASVDASTTDTITVLVGGRFSSNSSGGAANNFGTLAGTQVSCEHNGAGAVTLLEGLDVTVGGNGQAAAVNRVLGIRVQTPQGTTSAFTGTTELSGIRIDDQGAAPPGGAQVAALRIANQTNGASAIRVDGGASSFADGNFAGTLQISGNTSVTSISTSLTTQTATYSVLPSDHTINCNGTFTVTLPIVSILSGQEFYVKNIGTGVITVFSSANIDGSSSVVLGTQYESVTVQWDGTQYWVY